MICGSDALAGPPGEERVHERRHLEQAVDERQQQEHDLQAGHGEHVHRERRGVEVEEVQQQVPKTNTNAWATTW